MSKITKLTIAAALMGLAGVANAQVPSHPQYVQRNPTYEDPSHAGSFLTATFDRYFANWDPANPQPITEDDNFFISRVKPQQRFVDVATQVDPAKNPERKVCWWCPIGISDKSWSAIPRYKFDADAFSMWQYVDQHANWSDGWMRVPAAFGDAAHRNGVYGGCLMFFESYQSPTSDCGKILALLTEKNGDGTFKNLTKFIQFMKYYGIDGVGMNAEGSIDNTLINPTKEFFEECHREAAAQDWHFKVYWYDAQYNAGGVSWQNALNSSNSEWFQRSGKDQPVSDMFMLNYNWYEGHLDTSVNTAKGLGRSSFDAYAGFDIQGRWLTASGYSQPTYGWELLAKKDMSIALWGAHDKNMIYQNSNEFGSDALTIQTTYQKKLEQFFTGGTRNPATSPEVTNTITGSGFEQMKKFHGISKLVAAKSVLSNLPFVTRFGLGNGQYFNNEGKTTFTNEWYNLGVQDMLPTWRWWVVDDNGTAPADAVDCELTYTDAWFGGSSLKISGATAKSNIRMYKTNFDVTASTEISVTFKLTNGDASHLNLLWTADGTTFKTAPLASTVVGQWVTVKLNAGEIGMTGTVKEVGFTVENSPVNYSLLLGELSINDNKSYTPASPTITSSTVLAGTYNTVSYKLIWKSKDQDAAKPWLPIYNEDVDTWYFELYSQAEDGEPVLNGTTSSWAGYVVGAPASETDGVKTRFGVCAVAPDGVTKSPISWTDYMDRTIETSENIVINKSIIKANEEFTISFEDPTHAKSYSWEILNSTTGVREGTLKINVKTLTTSIATCGSYDLVVRSSRTDKNGVAYRALIQVSPDETGATPVLGDLTMDRTAAKAGEDINASFTVTRLGEGQVSRGVSVVDPQMLRLPYNIGGAADYTLTMWFKADKYAHSRFGTNLINKRDYTIGWPHNNWGTFWVHIWPDGAYPLCNENVISFTQKGEPSPGFNGNPHESPNTRCMGNDHSVREGAWTHVAIAVSGSKQVLWVNGMKVAEEARGFAGLNGSAENNWIYIGGSNVYHGGLIGTVDDIQVWNSVLDDAGIADAMKGYTNRTIPDGLQYYWDFENAPVVVGGGTEGAKSSFENKGKAGTGDATLASVVTFEGASGENQSGTVTVPVLADNDQLGNPALEGTLDVKTSSNWTLAGAPVSTEGDKTVNLKYSNAGTYDVTINLVNRWGKDSKTGVVVIETSGITDATVAETSVYPNPFVDGVNVMFAKEGAYEINVYSENGALVGSQKIAAGTSDVVYVAVNGNPGIYVVQVVAAGKVVKNLKVIKK